MSKAHARLNKKRWGNIRRFLLERAGYRCQLCKRPGRLEIDHVNPLEKHPQQDPYDINGLQVLCRKCHFEKTAGEQLHKQVPGRSEWQSFVRAF